MQLTKKNHIYDQQLGSIEQAKAVSKYPIFECLIGSLWKQNGLASIIITRINPKFSSHVTTSHYLVDMFCLGVKDAFIKHKLSLTEYFAYKTIMIDSNEGVENISYENVRSIIFGGLHYAKSLGFPPHKDWHIAQHAIEPERSYINKFSFGKDGKPCYIQGPHDHKRFCLNDIIEIIGRYNGKIVLMEPELFNK